MDVFFFLRGARELKKVWLMIYVRMQVFGARVRSLYHATRRNIVEWWFGAASNCKARCAEF